MLPLSGHYHAVPDGQQYRFDSRVVANLLINRADRVGVRAVRRRVDNRTLLECVIEENEAAGTNERQTALVKPS